MLEQLKKYWAKVSEHPFLKHLFIIVCVLLVLGVVFGLIFGMCAIAGLLAMRKLRDASPADMF